MKKKPTPIPGFTPVETGVLGDEWSTMVRCVCGAEMPTGAVARHEETCMVLHMRRVVHTKNNRPRNKP